MKEAITPGIQELEKIYQVLQKRKKFKQRIGTYSRSQDLAKKFLGEYSTSIARSELLASTDQIIDVQNKAIKIREWLIDNGTLLREDEFITKRVADDEFVASTNIEVNKVNIYKLFLSKDDKVNKIQSNFALHFDNTYEMLIEFPRGNDPRKAEVRYEIKGKKLNELAKNEAIIALSLMEEFIDRNKITE